MIFKRFTSPFSQPCSTREAEYFFAICASVEKGGGRAEGGKKAGENKTIRPRSNVVARARQPLRMRFIRTFKSRFVSSSAGLTRGTTEFRNSEMNLLVPWTSLYVRQPPPPVGSPLLLLHGLLPKCLVSFRFVSFAALYHYQSFLSRGRVGLRALSTNFHDFSRQRKVTGKLDCN